MQKSIKTQPRQRSVVTGKSNLEHLVTYRRYPVFIACTEQDPASDLFADMSFSICRDTGIIQLDNLIPPEILYSGYHSEALGALWSEHHKTFMKFFGTFSPKNVLEIGGSNCIMAEMYLRRRKKAEWTIVEPNPTKPANPRIKVIPKFFDDTIRISRDIDAVMHSHTLEHMYNPDAFLKTISSALADGALHIFSVPNLYQYLKNGYSNCVNFEHTIFLTEYFIDYFLAKHGFEIIKKHKFHEHSIFYATRKNSSVKPKIIASKYAEYKKRFAQYVKHNEAIVSGINKKISSTKGEVYLFGAHVFSQMLVNLGLKAKRITKILDNSKIKQGKRLYGTDLFVESPEMLKGKQRPVIILRVGAYKKEIQQQIRAINLTAIFIE